MACFTASPAAAPRILRTGSGRRVLHLALLVGGLVALGFLGGEQAQAADGAQPSRTTAAARLTSPRTTAETGRAVLGGVGEAREAHEAVGVVGARSGRHPAQASWALVPPPGSPVAPDPARPRTRDLPAHGGVRDLPALPGVRDLLAFHTVGALPAHPSRPAHPEPGPGPGPAPAPAPAAAPAPAPAAAPTVAPTRYGPPVGAPGVPGPELRGTTVFDGGAPRDADVPAVLPSRHRMPLWPASGPAPRREAAGTRDIRPDVPVFPG
ncbi:hypothetical protein QFZ66_003526 [Streptomyces sp. B4I13]|uniref:hypothetical protein n=1 Tax=Streptomyces sp. B4I13 TaxID=3042271 RepID=UPI002785247F|nr:hypothetical protein [Streptomyces sp. B4I13]MDQ0959648.1 hypothetical protein [Streptomyces sp. B4I13]